MFKLVAIWSAPKAADIAAFETAYRNAHRPKAAALPHLHDIETIRIGEGLEGADPAFYRVAVMRWADRAAFERDEQTAEWQSLRADAGEMIARFGVTLTSALGSAD